MTRFVLLWLVLSPAVGAQNLYTEYGTTSVGLSGAVGAPVAGDVDNDDAAFGVVLSGGTAKGCDASASVSWAPGASRDIRTVALGAAVYILHQNGLRIGPTLGVQQVTDGRFTVTAASLGAIVAQQLPVGTGLVVPQATVAVTAINGGGGVQGGAGVAVGFVLPLGRFRLLAEPGLAFAFEGGVAAASVRGGLIATL